MADLRSRLSRIKVFARLMIAVVIGSVTLVTAVAYWQSRLGYLAIALIGGVIVVTLLILVALPNSAWTRVAGIDTLADDLGRLHTEGALLRSSLPWVRDARPTGLDEWAAQADEWDARVTERLQGTRWLGTYLSPVGGFRTVADLYRGASGYRNRLDDKLERLAQIIRTIGGRS